VTVLFVVLRPVEDDTDSELRPVEVDTDRELVAVEDDVDSEAIPVEVEADRELVAVEDEVDSEAMPVEDEVDRLVMPAEAEVDRLMMPAEAEVDRLVMPAEVEVDSELMPVDSELLFVEDEVESELTAVDRLLRAVEIVPPVIFPAPAPVVVRPVTVSFTTAANARCGVALIAAPKSIATPIPVAEAPTRRRERVLMRGSIEALSSLFNLVPLVAEGAPWSALTLSPRNGVPPYTGFA
jgi:hypothetical protein